MRGTSAARSEATSACQWAGCAKMSASSAFPASSTSTNRAYPPAGTHTSFHAILLLNCRCATSAGGSEAPPCKQKKQVGHTNWPYIYKPK